MIWIFFIAFVVLLTLGLITLLVIRKQKGKFGVLTKKHIYQDTQLKPGETLYSRTIPLVGKPDYIIKDKNFIIPVEVKTGKTPQSPYLNHTMQLMAYCLLVEENYGVRPPGGYLQYPDKEFKVAYTKEAEESVREVVEEIKQARASGKEFQCKHPNHNL